MRLSLGGFASVSLCGAADTRIERVDARLLRRERFVRPEKCDWHTGRNGQPVGFFGENGTKRKVVTRVAHLRCN